MRAVTFREFGPAQVMALETIDTPVPGQGEVLIDVHAVSVNRTLDVFVRQGKYAQKPALPHILGVDPSGVITAVGPGVTTRKIGDRVVTRPNVGRNANGSPKLLGVTVWGGYAEFVKVPETSTFLVPDNVDFATATVVARHAPLAFTQLRDYGRIEAGQWVLIMGAAGGLGSAAVQAAKYLGASVIAGAGSDERVGIAMDLGADVGVNYRTEDLVEKVRHATGGDGVHVVLENIGEPDLFTKAMLSLRRSGRLVTAGGHGGGLVTVDVSHLYRNQLSIIGNPTENLADYELSLKAASEGRYKVVIEKILPLSAAVEAHLLVEERSLNGKVVLDPKR